MNLKGLTILICDDSILFRKQMKDYFSANGCSSIIEVASGQESIDAYKKYKPDIVFLDIIMPNKTGIEAINEIMTYDSDAYIIMFSSAGTQHYLKDAIFAGAHDFLQKPFDPNLVETIIEKYLSIKGGN